MLRRKPACCTRSLSERAPVTRWWWSVTASGSSGSVMTSSMCARQTRSIVPTSDPLLAAVPLLRPRLPRLLLGIALGALSLGSALALAGLSAWLITRAWQMPPVLDLSIAVVGVRTFAISRGVLHYCERLASHDSALRAAGSARALIYHRLANGPV